MTITPEDLKYTPEHEWLRIMSGGKARVGITDYAQKQRGEFVFVELPPVGNRFDAGDPFGMVEAVKTATEVYMPAAGQVTARNDQLLDDPMLINYEPYGDGWLIEVSLADPSPDGLMSAKEYDAYITPED
ncbi:glycine cleavage system protein GcvH [Streptomyces sp. NPDC017546]|uniref:glycine cleavage system protein GcvH n=1 Tax=Streptomyces sp. NPDC017546 TaxID=3365001 RepID=UPI00378B1BD7